MNHNMFCENVHPEDFERPNWYVLFVRSNQEKKVAERLVVREIEHYLPCYESVRQWKDRRVKLEIPLFTGYVFVRLPLIERTRALTIPHVVSLVGSRNQPSAISEEEIAWIKLGIAHGKAEPHPYPKVGERVMVTEGVMCGMEGVLLEKRNGARVVVSLDSIGRAFAVEVEAACVRSLAARSQTASIMPPLFSGRPTWFAADHRTGSGNRASRYEGLP